MSKKYYWLKLDHKFFKRHDVMIIESMPNGKDYVLFYLKLLLESVSHNGSLRFSEIIPYDDNMLATITNTNIDIVRSAMKVFTELKMISVLDDKTIYMNELNKMIGCETEWAKKKREYRKKQKPLLLESEDNEGTKKDSVRQEIDIELEKEIDIELEKDKEYKATKVAINQKYFTNDDINNLFLDFLENRKQMFGKKINTDLSIKKLVNNLNKMSDEEKITALNNSIERGYKGVFKDNKKQDEHKSKMDSFIDI